MEFPKHITVTAFARKHYAEFSTEPDGTVKMGGLEGRLIDLVSQALGFTYDIKIHPKTDWGSQKADGNWTGLLGTVSRGEADLALGTTFITPERSTIVDFSQVYVMDQITFVSRLPQELPPGLAYVYPFEREVWTYILVVCFAVPLVYSLMYRPNRSYLYSLVSFLGSVVKQPTESVFSMKIFMGSWLVFGLLVSFCYTAVLASFLSVELREKPVADFRELASLALGGKYKVFAHPAFLNNLGNDEDLKKLAGLIRKKKWFDESLWYLNKSRYDEKTSFIVPRIPLYLAFGQPPLSTMYISKDSCTNMEIAIVVNKNFCCKERLNEAITRINYSGIYDKLLAELFYKSWIRSFSGVKRNEEVVMTFRSIEGPLILLLIGLFSSVLVLLAEICYARGKLRGKKSKKKIEQK